jgi:murein DD-endopeptidase MepM/ murein hydrolase activator NlpD
VPPRDELSSAARSRIDAEIARNALALPIATRQAVPPQLFAWPLRASASYTAPDYHGVSNFVDLDAAFPGAVRDYECGTRTYDQASGYNHAGVDYFLWPFPWMLMDADAVEIVAAAPGVIVGKGDGQDDRSCPNHYSADWNAVYVRHADGTVALYGHMKKGSPTTKSIGASVALGEYLGRVGSSGFSTGPHLHFELHSSSQIGYTIIEGNTGTCNFAGSRYLSQRPYRQSRINRLATHSAPPDLDAGCPSPAQETPNFATAFDGGATLYVAAYFHDAQSGQATQYRILRPDQSVFASWSHASPGTNDASYWYWGYVLPAGPAGVWTVEATFQGVTTTSVFTLADAVFGDGYE